ncbi:MetQ/NlpA family ABC transporter substrate-binding protein [Lacticaseibacillus saniviri]
MKQWIKRSGLAVAILGLGLLIAACGQQKSSSDSKNQTVTIGVTTGPHELIMKQVAKLAKKDGLTIKLKEFTDYNTPNVALNDGSLQGNSYQTLGFLKTQIKQKDFKITDAFKTVAFPMGVYSKHIKSLKDLKKGDTIAVPNDPANELRALQLFEKAGVIKLKAGVTTNATKADVTSNPLNLKIEELEASQLPTHLSDVQAAAINTNFAFDAGLNINDNAIYHEPLVNNPYPNYFVVQTSDKNAKFVKTIKKLYQSQTIRDYIKKTFKGSIVPAF